MAIAKDMKGPIINLEAIFSNTNYDNFFSILSWIFQRSFPSTSELPKDGFYCINE